MDQSENADSRDSAEPGGGHTCPGLLSFLGGAAPTVASLLKSRVVPAPSHGLAKALGQGIVV